MRKNILLWAIMFGIVFLLLLVNMDIHPSNFASEPKSRVYTQHNPLRINSDSELEAIAQSEGWDGDGTFLNPYEIKYYTIDGMGHSAIFLGNTTKWVVISHCELYNSTMYEDTYHLGAAVHLYRAENVIIGSSYFNHSSYGVYMYYLTRNVTITYNHFYGLGKGVYAYFQPRYITVTYNEFYNCYDGIRMEYSIADSTFKGNYIENSYTNGIRIDGTYGYCSRINIVQNTINGSSDTGIYLTNSKYCEIDGNTVRYAGNYGLGLEFLEECEVTNNTIDYSTSYGIAVFWGAYNNITLNTIRWNNGAGDTYDSSHIQAYDSGTTYWYRNGKGNYWSDWTSPDNNGDGIVDYPYAINGSANSQDVYPLVNPPTEIPEVSLVPIVLLAILLELGCLKISKGQNVY